MNFLLEGLRQAWILITSFDADLVHITLVTLRVALYSTLGGLLLGLPIGVTLGIGKFRGRGVLLVVANLGLGLPPVVIGLILAVLMYPAGPLGRFHLLYTLNGMYIAQTVLAVPLIAALTASAVRNLPAGLLDQARAFGAGRLGVAVLALREARIGVMAATIASVGSALSEVGAIVLVGGNVAGYSQTLASASLERFSDGRIAEALAVGVILLALILLITALLTWLQYGRRQDARVRAS